MGELRVDYGPAASVDVLLGHTFDVSVEFEFNEAGGQDVEGSGWPVLDDYDGVEVFGDEFAEAREVLHDGLWVDWWVR